MNKEHKEIWTALTKPFPPEAYKQVSYGRTFTSIDAYHIIERLTEVFGLMGQDGWMLMNIRYEMLDDSVACIGDLVALKYGIHVSAVGDGVVMMDKKGRKNIAEAYKKAQTNLISKAASYLGVGLDVYQGKHDSDPYLDRASQETKPPGWVTPSDDLGF